MALAAVGFIVFIAIVSQAYTAYQQKAFIADHYQDAASLAQKLSRDSALKNNERLDLIDAGKVESFSQHPGELFEKYGSFYNFMLKVEAKSEGRAYSMVVRDPAVPESGTWVSASVPVTVKLNDVEELPGTLTVKIWRK